MKLYLIKLKNILQSRYLFKVLFIFSLLYIFLYIKLDKKESIYDFDDTTFTGIVTSYKYENDKYTIFLKNEETLVVTYKTDSKIDIQYGDTLKLTGTLSKPSNNTIFNLFNYKKYLERKNIYYILNADSINKIKSNENIIYDIKNLLVKRISKICKSSSYIFAFVLGIKNNIDDLTLTSYQENGVSHLFAISGMHISFLSGILYYLLKKVSYNNYYNFFIIFIFLLFYALLLDSPISVVRTIIMFVVFKLNKLFNLKIRKLDLMMIVFMIITINNPFVIYELSFQISYIISFYLVIFSKKINKVKYKKLFMSFICFIVSLPIVLYNYYQVSIISVLLNLIFIPFVSLILFPLSIITLIFPFLDNILFFFINLLEYLSKMFSSIDLFKIVFPKPSIYLIIFYYILITLFIYNKKFIYLFLLTLIIHKNYTYFDNKLKVVFLDVSQGDSTLITYKNKTILIDTGGSYFYNDMSLTKTIPYLKSLGRTKINYLIITHGDFDHMGEAINIVNNIKVEKVIFNCGEYNELEKELINLLDKNKIKYYRCIKELNIDKYKLQFLNTKEYDNENDNSNVIYFNYNNYKFLFMGDAGIDKEEDILEKYDINDIDFLKVGHHGSDTSSSKEFIDSINPKYSLISVGKNNRYGHPKESVLATLKDSKVYRTDLDGSIEIKLNRNGYKIGMCNP